MSETDSCRENKDNPDIESDVFSDALEVCSETAEEDTLSDEEKRQKTLELKEQGNSQFKSGQYELAIESYTSAVQICPEEDHATRAILYSNLAAAKDHLDLHEEAINFCTEALALCEQHSKALLRRAKLYHKCDKLDESLADYEKYAQLMPDDAQARRAIQELKIEIDQRNEKMKTEMLGKLKDLGNMVLKPFGLSTNNFQLVKNPENGSYSVNFQNN